MTGASCPHPGIHMHLPMLDMSGCRGMVGVLSVSPILFVFLTPHSFYLLLTSLFLLISFPFLFPLPSSHPHCSSSTHFPSFLSLDWLPLLPATYVPFKISHSFPPPWSAFLPPPQPGFVPLSFPTHRALAPGGLIQAFLCFHSYHTTSGNSSSEQ